MTRILTEEAQAEADDFQIFYGDGGCSCHINPPCFYCTHPGNPINLEEDDSAWMCNANEEMIKRDERLMSDREWNLIDSQILPKKEKPVFPLSAFNWEYDFPYKLKYKP